jgi:hypothetical protein
MSSDRVAPPKATSPTTSPPWSITDSVNVEAGLDRRASDPLSPQRRSDCGARLDTTTQLNKAVARQREKPLGRRKRHIVTAARDRIPEGAIGAWRWSSRTRPSCQGSRFFRRFLSRSPCARKVRAGAETGAAGDRDLRDRIGGCALGISDLSLAPRRPCCSRRRCVQFRRRRSRRATGRRAIGRSKMPRQPTRTTR